MAPRKRAAAKTSKNNADAAEVVEKKPKEEVPEEDANVPADVASAESESNNESAEPVKVEPIDEKMEETTEAVEEKKAVKKAPTRGGRGRKNNTEPTEEAEDEDIKTKAVEEEKPKSTKAADKEKPKSKAAPKKGKKAVEKEEIKDESESEDNASVENIEPVKKEKPKQTKGAAKRGKKASEDNEVPEKKSKDLDTESSEEEKAPPKKGKKAAKKATTGVKRTSPRLAVEHWKALELHQAFLEVCPELELELNGSNPRRGSFELKVINANGCETLLWSGIKLGPPRRLKFPDPDSLLSDLEKALA